MDRRRNPTDNGASKLTPRTRQTASLFVADWIENAPNERHDSRESGLDFEKPRSFARRKNAPRSGPFSAMYFGNDVIINPRNRPLRENWESENPRSARKLSYSDDINDRLSRVESAPSTGRSRQAAPPSPVPSDISLAEDSRPIQRAKREGCGSSKRTSKSPGKSTRARQGTATAPQEDSPNHDMFLRERELFLRDRALFLRERELFLSEKQQFHSEKDALLQERGNLTNKAIADILNGLLKQAVFSLTTLHLSLPTTLPLATSSRHAHSSPRHAYLHTRLDLGRGILRGPARSCTHASSHPTICPCTASIRSFPIPRRGALPSYAIMFPSRALFRVFQLSFQSIALFPASIPRGLPHQNTPVFACPSSLLQPPIPLTLPNSNPRFILGPAAGPASITPKSPPHPFSLGLATPHPSLAPRDLEATRLRP